MDEDVSGIFQLLSKTKQYTIIDLGADAWSEVTRLNNDGQVLGYRHFESTGK